MYAKVAIKIPQIVRWRIAGIPDTRIEALLNMSSGGLARILATQEYKDHEAAYLNGYLGKMDEALAGKVNEIRKGFQVAVPAAMRALVDAVTQRKDLRTMLAAASEILDRDPDRTLVASRDSAVGESIPQEVLDHAVAGVTATANSYSSDKTKVN